MSSISEIISPAFWDSVGMLPFLFAIYLLIEWLEHGYGARFRSKVAHAGGWGPLVGAVLGCFPQCGFSVIGAGLYARRLITVGTMIAIFVATSDEAVPVILAQIGRAGVVVPLIATKFLLGVFFGYLFDRVLFRNQRLAEHHHEPVCGDWPDCEVVDIHELGCCGHPVAEKKGVYRFLLHPLRHTISVFIFIFVVNVAIGFVIAHVGEDRLDEVMFKSSVLQPILCALVGLIPNCAVSVAMTQLYLAGGIGFGSAIAGLSSSGGLGLLVLVRENRSIVDTLKVVGLLLIASALSGIVIQAFAG
jgi:hypothetical protein